MDLFHCANVFHGRERLKESRKKNIKKKSPVNCRRIMSHGNGADVFSFFFVISFFSFPTRIPAAHFLFCVGRRTPDAGAETAAPMGRKKKNKRNAKTTFYRVRRCSISNKSTSLCLYTPTYYLLTYHLLLTYLLLTTYLPLLTYY